MRGEHETTGRYGIQTSFPRTVPDLPRSLAFFRDALGFAAGYQWPSEAEPGDIEFIILSLDGASVGLGRGEADVAPSGAQLCIEVTDIHAAWTWVTEHGATPITPPAQERWNEWSAFSADPSGPRIMLYARP